ncbi:MAG: redoxin domain-containing protein [Anaerolineae bacterium]|nr:redoxin domain-containing protein [Anaerolineae bacterium]
MEQHQAELAEAGLQVVAVGMGESKHAQRYCGKLAPSIDCLTDESYAAYGVYGLQQAGVKELLNPGMVTASVRAFSGGYRQGQAEGDVRMLPGTFIIDRQGIVRFAYYSAHAGDHPPLADLFNAAAVLRETSG